MGSENMSNTVDLYKAYPHETEMGTGQSTLPEHGPSRPPSRVSSRLVFQPTMEERGTDLEESKDNECDRGNTNDIATFDPGVEPDTFNRWGTVQPFDTKITAIIVGIHGKYGCLYIPEPYP
jgi:hypothetical protein